MGEVPPGQALRRDGAQAGDDVWVSGVIGSAATGAGLPPGPFVHGTDRRRQRAARALPADAAGGTRHRAARRCDQRDRYFRRSAGRPRTHPGALRRRRGPSRPLEFAALPTLPVVQQYLHEPVARDCVLAGGDDYELCFTAPAGKRDAVHAAAESTGVAVTRIGRIASPPNPGSRSSTRTVSHWR